MNRIGRFTISRIDFILFFSTLMIIVLGLLFLYSASKNLFSMYILKKQIIWIFVGIIILLITLSIDYRKFIDLAYPLYVLNIFMLILVLLIGHEKGGARRWITFGGFNFQPSEFAKLSLILALASFMGRRKDLKKGITFVGGACLLATPLFVLILIEPDLGGGLLLLPAVLGMLFIGGAGVRYIIGLCGLGVLSLPFFWHFLKGYQKQRLLTFINPNMDPLGTGYTIIQSKIAIGSGGFLGKGWLSGTQNQLNFLPERHTDFIFSVVGEVWGFIGSLVLILVYTLILYRIAKIIDMTTDVYGKLIAAGFLSIFAVQIVVNIGMTIGIFPVVGLTLPFVSYGGSSLITNLLFVGLMLNIAMRRPTF